MSAERRDGHADSECQITTRLEIRLEHDRSGSQRSSTPGAKMAAQCVTSLPTWTCARPRALSCSGYLKTIADDLFPGAPIGQSVRVMNLPFQGGRRMARKGTGPAGRDQDDTAFAPYTAVQKKLLGNTRVQGRLCFGHLAGCDLHGRRDQITELLRHATKLSANEPNDFSVRNISDVAEAANETNNMIRCCSGASRAYLAGGRIGS